MPTASRPTFLRQFGRALSPRREPDLADMGTAFALDEALDQPHHGTLSPFEATPPQRPVPVAPWRLWLGRKLGS